MENVNVPVGKFFCNQCKNAKIEYITAVRNTVCECQKIGGCSKMERFKSGEPVFTL